MPPLVGGPPPKDASQRRRRNATLAMTQLPAEGYKGEIPEFPLQHATVAELERWNTLWRLPQAAAWARMNIVLTVARYVRTCLIVENDTFTGKTTVAGVNLHSEVRQQEDRLGLSPLAMLRLRWEVVADEVEEQRSSRGPRRVRAVESDAAEG